MLFIPLIHNTVRAAVRCQRHQLQISLDYILEAVVLVFVALEHIHHQAAGTNRTFRQQEVLLTLSVLEIAACCHLRITGFHHHVLSFRRHSLNIQLIILQAFVDLQQHIIFIAMLFALFINP